MDKIELIDRAAVRALAYRSSDWSHGEHPLVVELSDIDDLPTIDAAPVRRGEWVMKPHKIFGNIYDYVCSECGCDYALSDYNFCPHCGADMRGEAE